MAEGFAAIPTWMIRDTENVSGFAIAVYGVLASRSGYRSNFPGQELIAKEARCSERKVRDALGELEQLGVVERVKRGAKGGGRRTDAYRLMDRPLGEDEETIPAPDAGNGGFPAREEGVSGTSEQTVPYIEIDRAEEIDRARASAVDLDALFSEAWSFWPKKDKRKDSLAKFKVKVREHFSTEPGVLVEYVRRFGRAYAESTETKFVPALVVWLNGERWTDPLPQRSARSGGTAVERMVDRIRNAQHPTEGGDQFAIGA